VVRGGGGVDTAPKAARGEGERASGPKGITSRGGGEKGFEKKGGQTLVNEKATNGVLGSSGIREEGGEKKRQFQGKKCTG